MAQPETAARSKSQSVEIKEPGVKPRKVNSEVRKQQNRIASRNYREKRKRKLRQLEQLLEDDDPGENQVHVESTASYEDRSCSGSVRHERFDASSSPHIATLSGHSSPPEPDHAMISNQTSFVEQSLPYTYPYLEPSQQTTAYNTSTVIERPSWNIPWTAETSSFTPVSSQQPAYATYPSYWQPLDFGAMYPHTTYQQEAVMNPGFYLSQLPYQYNENLQAETRSDTLGKRCYPYEPC